ncbi:hypothetical protein E2F50_19480 [Rhizobium deserti]|uniref:ATP-binding protein n=1 Tax=Rhizobium deserti TaxID=2547961 RepID=A0A4R5UAX5_9HYPH|nr:hypothetical protein [Rhizobium deserti]TDK31844.1 hypothetical protein E2F50_19480 [Rhizobium deserti]
MISLEARPAATTPAHMVPIKKGISVLELERILAAEVTGQGRKIDFKLPKDGQSVVLADMWTSIVLGTLAAGNDLRLIAWGLKEIEAASRFTTTPAFLAALTMADAIAAEFGTEVDRDAFQKRLSLTQLGLVEPESGVAQTLVEFDPEFSVAPVLRGGSGFDAVSPLDRNRIFENLIMKFRQRLEVAAIRNGVSPSNAGPARSVARFLRELHDNAVEHGSRDRNGRTLSATRIMRLRKHVANTKALLVERCGDFEPLARHVYESFAEGGGAPALVEASISDFGLGIVDGFLLSDAGRRYARYGRRDLLQALIYERLSSKSSDTSAGLGLQNALIAARQMGAFVSLRTGEFWLVVSFASDNGEPKLNDVSSATHSRVAGTHWQILWTQS